MSREDNSGRTALVTGASGGIGYELARRFGEAGFDLVLVARSEAKLNEIAADFGKRYAVKVRVIARDLSVPGAPQEIFDEVQVASVRVDALVNNAGFTVFGRFVETSLEDELQLLQVNIVALTHLTKLFLPSMVERGWGRILNLGSTAAFQPGPLMAAYYASKAYVLFFSEAIATELEGTGVTVTALCPGPTASGFQKRGKMEDSRLVAGRKLLEARAVARIGYSALMKGQTVVIPGRSNFLFAQAMRFLPRSLARRIVYRAQERVGK